MKSRRVALREVLEVQNGFAFRKELFDDSVGVPLIRIRDLGKDSTETRYKGEFRDEFLVNPGAYLIGMDGNFRCRRWSGSVGLLNQRVCRLWRFSDAVEPEYIFYGMQPALSAIEAKTAFTTVKHISSKQILDIELALPPLTEQRRVVDLLSRVESLARLHREGARAAAELLQSLVAEEFSLP